MARAFLRHAFVAGYCRDGVRRWMERYGVEPSEVIGPNAPGIETARLRAFGARPAIAIAEIAEREAGEMEARKLEAGEPDHG